MPVKYLLDENLDPEYRTQLVRHSSALIVWAVGDPGAPAKGTPDPAILYWCEEHHFILVTKNRRSMPEHLADHLAEEQHVPGIFVLRPEMSPGKIIEELILIAETSMAAEYADRITYLPLT